LVEHALPDAAAFGQAHAEEIARLVDVADLSLLPISDAAPRLRKAIESESAEERFWGLIACSCFGQQAGSLAGAAKERLADSEPLVRVRAAEFLALTTGEDPRPALYKSLAATDSPWEALLTLNTIIFLHDRDSERPFDASRFNIPAKSGEVNRRLEYLTAD
jgi:hypothetical protein